MFINNCPLYCYFSTVTNLSCLDWVQCIFESVFLAVFYLYLSLVHLSVFLAVFSLYLSLVHWKVTCITYHPEIWTSIWKNQKWTPKFYFSTNINSLSGSPRNDDIFIYWENKNFGLPWENWKSTLLKENLIAEYCAGSVTICIFLSDFNAYSILRLNFIS